MPVCKLTEFSWSLKFLFTDLPAGHFPRIFARRHLFVKVRKDISQLRYNVIIVPCKAGTDFFHYKEKNKFSFRQSTYIAKIDRSIYLL